MGGRADAFQIKTRGAGNRCKIARKCLFPLSFVFRAFAPPFRGGRPDAVAAVTLRNVTKRWGAVVAVDDLTLEAADREFIALLGPSGCGKTTTMRMVAGLEDLSAGEIRIGGRMVNDLEPKERDVAMVFQSYALYPHLTVEGNIGFPLTVRKRPAGEIRRRAREAAEMVEITGLLDRKPAALSGGQRQRVALARAIVRKPAVFLMDEPLSNLDAKLRASMRAQLKNLQRRLATTTIYVTHDQVEAMTLADRVAVMRDGVLRQLAPPAEIYDEPADLFVAGFIGSPAMNTIRGEMTDGVFSCPDFRLPGFSAPPGPVVLGIRPEDAEIRPPDDGTVSAPVFAVELTGDATLVTLKLTDGFLTVRGHRKYRAADGASAAAAFTPAKCHLFHARTEKRIPPRNEKEDAHARI